MMVKRAYWGRRVVRILSQPFSYPAGNCWGYGPDLRFVKVEVVSDPERIFPSGEQVEVQDFELKDAAGEYVCV